MRRLALISVVAVMVLAACGGGSGATTAPGGATGTPGGPTGTKAPKSTPAGGQATGGGSVTVTVGGASYTVKGGDCGWGKISRTVRRYGRHPSIR